MAVHPSNSIPLTYAPLILPSLGIIAIVLGGLELFENINQNYSLIVFAVIGSLMFTVPCGAMFWAMRSLEQPLRSYWVGKMIGCAIVNYICIYGTMKTICSALAAS